MQPELIEGLTCSGSLHRFINLVIDMLPALFLLLEAEWAAAV